VVGIHAVEEAPDPCHLVEMRLEGEGDERLDLRAITQETAGDPGSTWQTPSGEHLLDASGERGRPLDEEEVSGLAAPARVAFFFHFLRLDRPLLTPAGPVKLPPAAPRPERLRFLRYI
jgi:hypothetical protein